jgi:8-oxo-dGTP pyrophosphatase MutT (NUDIX family)
MSPESALANDGAPVPAATILLLRDGDSGLELFMVRRHHEIEFAAGALVFPGGKAARDDFDPALADLADGISGWTKELPAVGAAAIREAFEEAGVLLARDNSTGELVNEARLGQLDSYREPLEKNEISLLQILRQERLRLACDQLVHFAHWVTPQQMPKRYDTHFFLARAPLGHAGQHCGRESVDSLWVRPQDALAHRKQLKIMFPTRLNLMKLARARDADEALAAARVSLPVTVEPWIEDTPEGKRLRIREDAGYELTNVALKDG